MRVVVAGSSGLIGTALVDALHAAGHEVTRLVRRPSSAPDERAWDPPAGKLDGDVLEGVDAVVNMCGAPIATRRWSHSRKQVLLDSRVEPTEVLAAAVAEHGVPFLLNATAVGYYGNGGDRVLEDSEPRGEGFLAGLCSDWEAATRRAEDAGVRVVHLRTGHVLSRHGGLLRMLRPLFTLMLGARLGDGRQYMPWITLADQLAAIRFVLETPALSGPVNACAPNPVTNTEFTRALARAVNRPAPWFVPRPALRLAVGEGAAEILYSQRAVPKALQDNGFVFGYPRLEDGLKAALR
jgi:uncharacterized protein